MIEIKNQRQYRATKAQIANLHEILKTAHEANKGMDPDLLTAMVAGIQSLIEELGEQVEKYEKLPERSLLHLDSIKALPDILIMARLARGYSHKDFAEILKVKPQQIQRYESTAYRSVGLKRVIDIMGKLNIDFETDIFLQPISGFRSKHVTWYLPSDELGTSTGMNFRKTHQASLEAEKVGA